MAAARAEWLHVRVPLGGRRNPPRMRTGARGAAGWRTHSSTVQGCVASSTPGMGISGYTLKYPSSGGTSFSDCSFARLAR